MSIFTDLQDSIYDSLKPIFPDKEIVWMYLNNLEPEDSYIGLYVLEMDQVGREEYSTNVEPIDASGNYSILLSSQYEATLQVNFRGSEAQDLALRLNQATSNPYFWEIWDKNKLSIMRKSSLRSAPQKRDTQWVMGFNQDLTLSFAYTQKQMIDPIEKIILVDKDTGEEIIIPQ